MFFIYLRHCLWNRRIIISKYLIYLAFLVDIFHSPGLKSCIYQLGMRYTVRYSVIG